MTPADLLIITALVIVALVAVALLVAGGGLLARVASGRGPATMQPGATLDVLDRQWHLERRLYRHHRLVGIAIMGGAAFFIWQMLGQGLLSALSPAWQPLWWTLLVGNALNMAIGAVLAIRPSRLKPVESLANRWIAVDGRHVTGWLAAHPLLRGLFLLAIAVFALATAALLLADRIENIVQ